ncbi:hypothetical protein F2P56_036180, partial [Juglans regia]
MDFYSTLLCLCCTWVIFQAFRKTRSTAISKKLPPGPKPFPIIGNLLDLGDKPHKSLAKLAQIHGPIVSLKLGQVTTIIISSAETAKEVLQTHDQLLSSRTIPDAVRAHKQDEFGLPWIPISTQWRNLRKICNDQLFSKKALDANQNIRGMKLQELLAETRQSTIVKETFRLHPVVPLLLPRKAKADAEINGYTIPKGAQVLVNAWAIGRDPSLWDNANSFMPERFLGLEIDVKGRNFELIPFGGGRRICPGLPLAIRMLHLMLGSLVHNFDWKLEEGVKSEDMSMEDKFALTLQIAHPLRAIPIPV